MIHAEFVLSAASPKQFPTDGLPELALVGRSNVGKSSLINRLLGRQKLARTSSNPGATRTLNFYRVYPGGAPKGDTLEAWRAVGAFYLVDCPGYGYAKVSAAEREAWGRLIEGYLTQRETLRGVLEVVDLRHPPSKDDQQMWGWLAFHGKKRIAVATKADKLKRQEMDKNLAIMRKELDPPPAADELLMYSSETGLGRDALWQWVTHAVQS
jgi:GTP-binding protein